ncbi:MAG: virulence RhuM family protein [Micrococcales bacterium]|nr:virulence RhuM family protein [Micrococcales bacterium]MCL2667668.1 virulence RhuM family protein [Micrococcales bacterium]
MTSAPPSQIVWYQTDDGRTRVDVRMVDETVWLSQAQMVELFQSSKANVSEHIKHVFDEGELEEEAVVRKFRTTASDGKTYQVTHYNLDVIISVGYRVKSLRGTQFRRWALGVLKEYLTKGFAMNDPLLKEAGGGSYWRELLDRIRDIRSSEKVFYRQVLDLYATSVDYDPRTPESLEFFKIVQYKMHYAAHGHTAAEVIADRADAGQPFMGLTVFDGAQPRRAEVVVAKNYLTEPELATLNRMVSAFLDLAELRAMQRVPMYMRDWVAELDDFATRYGQGVPSGPGTVSHDDAVEHATEAYDEYLKRLTAQPSPAELDYLDAITTTGKQIEKDRRSRPKPGGAA